MKDYVYNDMLIKHMGSNWYIYDEHDIFFGRADSVRIAKDMIKEFRLNGNESTKARLYI